MKLRERARRIFEEALHAVRIDAVMEREVRCVDGVLRVKGLSYRLADFERLMIVAMGKAAGPMTDGVLLALGREGIELEGVVVGATSPKTIDARVRFLRGSHPIPDESSAVAADAVLELLRRCDAGCLVLVLLSGGASSMVEKPLDVAMTMEDAADLHRALVHSGLAIGEMNALRKHFSAVKGGRLAVAASGATLCTVVVSDVPPNAMDVVGSGPSLPDVTTVETCRKIMVLLVERWSLRRSCGLTLMIGVWKKLRRRWMLRLRGLMR